MAELKAILDAEAVARQELEASLRADAERERATIVAAAEVGGWAIYCVNVLLLVVDR